jgi:hypothetical protein
MDSILHLIAQHAWIKSVNDFKERWFGKLEKEKLDLEREKHACKRWWQEDQLIHQRLSWLLTSHGVIGAGYAWLKHRIAEVGVELATIKCDPVLLEAQEAYRDQLIGLSEALVLIGLTISVLILLGVGSALWAQYILQGKYNMYELSVSKHTTRGGYVSALAMPIVCICAWVWIAFTP